MRPIVSTINSPSYKLAKELARILTPLAGNTAYTVRNSTAFVERIRGLQTTPQDTLVSFDVKNLFTQVPVEAALTVVEDRLYKDPTLSDRTSIPVPQLVELTSLCLRSTYFQLGEKFYEQTDGAAMGSPLSPVIANLYLESLEETAIRSAPLKPNLWVRYVDDTFVIWPHGPDRLRSFYQHLNKQHPKIQFTVEEEKDDQLPFLDVCVSKEGGRLLTSVYRKPTHTERYIPYHSHHHPRTTTGVLRCMRDRARSICHPTKMQQEMDHLNQVFQANGFPKNLVKKTLTTHPPPLPETSEPQQQVDEAPKILCTPYIKGLSEKIAKVCAPLGVKPVFRPKKTLKRELMQVKNRTPEQKQTGVVYEIPCKDCPEVYVGETKRTLKVRLSEHRQAVKRGDPKNGIAVHVQKTNHCINWEGATVQRRAEGFWLRRTVEAIQIRKATPNMNLDSGLLLPMVWNPILNPHPSPHTLVLVYCHHTSSLAFVCLVNSACLHTLLFVTYFSQSQAHTQSCNIIGHLRAHPQSRNIIGYLCTHSQSRNIIGYLCTHSTSHKTIGQCLLYNLSHTAVSLVLYAVDKGLRGRNVLQSLLLILLRICSRSVRPISTK